jgi:hypothetical protein
VSVRPRSLAFLVGAAALAGCGGGSGDAGPRLARADAAPLIALAHRIGHEGACAQARDIRALARRANRLVASRRVPGALAAPLDAGVRALTRQAPACVPRVAPAPAPAAPPPPRPRKPHGHGHGHGEGDNGNGRGEGG